MHYLLKKSLNLFLTILCIAVFVFPKFTYADNFIFIFNENESIENQTYNFLTSPVKNGGCGLTTESAAAIMGCIEHESSWRENAENPFDGGFGVLQWTFGRRARLISWCNEYGFDPNSLEGQMMFFRNELYNSYSETNGYHWPVCETLTTSRDVEEALKMFFCHMEAGENVSLTDTPYSKHSAVTTKTLYEIRLKDAIKYYEFYTGSEINTDM